jgi:tetratricopeptide (TPR) repeat protein
MNCSGGTERNTRRPWFGCAVLASIAGLVILSAAAHAQSAHPDKSGGPAQQANSQRQSRSAKSDQGQPLEIDPNASVEVKRRALTTRAAVYEAANDLAAAEADFAAAFALQPVDPALYVERGYFYLRTKRFGDALEDFLTGERLEPTNPRFRYAAGRLQATRGNYSAAIIFYNEAIRLNPHDASYFLARAEAHVRLAMLPEARADYDSAIAIGLQRPSDRFFAYLGRGYLELVSRDYSRAISDLDQALAVDPEAVNALLWRGYAREKGGRTDLALADYERAVAADPKDQWARANLRRLRSTN